MPRRIRAITLWLIIGAAMNFAGAWALTWRPLSSRMQPAVTRQDGGLAWPPGAPESWPPPDRRLHRAGFGRDLYCWEHGHAAPIVFVEESGWPMRSVYSVNWSRQRGERVQFARSFTIPDTDPLPTRLRGRRLPIGIRWFGAAVNTAVFASLARALVWTLWSAPIAVRRARRRQRGLCPRCAYPVGVSPVCTECGTPLSVPRTTVSPP